VTPTVPEIVPDISVSIVSYNTKDILIACIESLLRSEAEGEAALEIIVADNGSTDGTPEAIRSRFPTVIFIDTGGNIGYGRANNAALHSASGRYFFIINSDIEMAPGAIAKMLAFMEANPKIGMIGAQLILPDGSIQGSCARDPTLLGVFWEQTYLDKLYPDNTITGSYLMTDWDYNSIREVPQVCGACFFVRAEAFRKIDGFDPAYFMYFEDTDFCVRLRKCRWPIYFFPEARIKHHLGASSGKSWRSRAMMISSYNQSRYYYYRRNHGKLQAIGLKAIVTMGAVLRLVAWSALSIVRPSARNQMRLFGLVFLNTVRMNDRGTSPTRL
jgi:GT2 family glycosyltransferase